MATEGYYSVEELENLGMHIIGDDVLISNKTSLYPSGGY